MNEIIVNKLDSSRLMSRLKLARVNKSCQASDAEKLTQELNRAKLCDPKKIPGDVVTMNSIVRISFLNTNKTTQFQIVYPDQANIKENKISIFSPVATALIGYKAGDEIEWIVPSGLTSIKIEKIIYQPEAAGDIRINMIISAALIEGVALFAVVVCGFIL